MKVETESDMLDWLCWVWAMDGDRFYPPDETAEECARWENEELEEDAYDELLERETGYHARAYGEAVERFKDLAARGFSPVARAKRYVRQSEAESGEKLDDIDWSWLPDSFDDGDELDEPTPDGGLRFDENNIRAPEESDRSSESDSSPLDGVEARFETSEDIEPAETYDSEFVSDAAKLPPDKLPGQSEPDVDPVFSPPGADTDSSDTDDAVDCDNDMHEYSELGKALASSGYEGVHVAGRELLLEMGEDHLTVLDVLQEDWKTLSEIADETDMGRERVEEVVEWLSENALVHRGPQNDLVELAVDHIIISALSPERDE